MTLTEPQADLGDIQEQLHAVLEHNEFLTENLAQLELALDEQGWQRADHQLDWEFSREGLDQIIALARLNALKNPLIKRGIRVRAQYVFGQGVEITADDEDVNEVVQRFIDDRGNRTELFGHRARMAKERTLSTDGQVVFILFPNKVTGHVSLRSVDVLEVRDVICNPQDRTEPWFYLRRWTERRIASRTGGTISREAWYPAWTHEPRTKPDIIDGIPVVWDQGVIYHAKSGAGLESQRFGIPDVYAALDWAKAYKLFLEDWATIVRSLSRFAWKQTVKKNPKTAAARMGANRHGTNPSPAAGSVYTTTEGGDLQPLPKNGATVDSEDGVWLAKMVGAALDLPYTILMGDPDIGNLATAKTLDRPTELAMMDVQQTWAEIIQDLCSYAIDIDARAAGGILTGATITQREHAVVVELPDADERTGRQRRTVDVAYPPILESDPKALVEAVTMANDADLIAPELVLRLLLLALGVTDVDEHLEAFDPDVWKAEHSNLGLGLLDAFRQGQDPAELLR